MCLKYLIPQTISSLLGQKSPQWFIVEVKMNNKGWAPSYTRGTQFYLKFSNPVQAECNAVKTRWILWLYIYIHTHAHTHMYVNGQRGMQFIREKPWGIRGHLTTHLGWVLINLACVVISNQLHHTTIFSNNDLQILFSAMSSCIRYNIPFLLDWTWTT